MAHSDYWADEAIRVEADKLIDKIWNKSPKRIGIRNKPRKIRVSYKNKVVAVGTANELSKIMPLSKYAIRGYACRKSRDSFGKLYTFIN